ncbi:MAG: DJ-1/PfpI family protein [Candidatus Thorarchaeota archaeon]
MKSRYVALLGIVMILGSLALVAPAPAVESPDELKVLILVANGFGWSYFDARDCLEDWGVNVSVLAHALDYEVDACYNRPARTIMADILTTEMTVEIMREFDCLFVPSGGHWSPLVSSQTVLDWVSTAYEEGLVVAGVCIGDRVLVRANNIVNGSKVAYYSQTNTEMTEEGADVTFSSIVADNRIVTGGAGGGFPGGFDSAPTYEVCATMVREALGQTFVSTAAVSPLEGFDDTNFTVTVELTNLSATFDFMNTSDIQEVKAHVYFENRTFVRTVTLEESSGVYSDTIGDLELGSYLVDVEVKDWDWGMHVERNATAFIVNVDETTTATTSLIPTTSSSTTSSVTSTTTPETPTTIDPMLLPLGIVGAGVVVVIIGVVVIKKRA